MRCALRILKPDVLTAHGSRSPPALCTDTCAAFCTSGLARAIKDTVKCTVDLPVLGITTAAHTSDAGQQIQYGHGAMRSKGRPPTPETAYLEQYDILVNNDVEHPRVNRDSVSCRRPHRESQNGFYTPPLDNAGNPKKRTGFMVPCQTSSDCYSRCGEHPTSGMAYVCTKNPLFYTFHVVNESLTEETLAVELSAQDLTPGLPVGTDYDSFEARLAVLEARPTWIPKADTVSTQSYFVDEPGENRFDVPTGSGVCTDVRMEFQHSGCESRVGSAAVVGLVGCTAKLGANLAYCGARVDRYGPDFLETSISSESLEYPRTLVEGTVVNGIPQGKVECSDAIDCMTKCERLGRISRDGGLDVPLACALCSSVCPTNLGTTIVDGIEALAVDVGNAVRLTEKCFTGGLGGCVCNILLSLKPAWIDTLPSPQERCEGGNIFGLLATKILELTLKSVEEAINENAIRPVNFIIDGINNVIRSLFRAVSFGSNNGPKLPRVPEACLTGYFNPGGQCFSGDDDFFKQFSCYNTDRASADKQCYFFRQRAICGLEGGTNRYGRYQELFTAPTGTELELEYQSVAGSSYSTIHPTLAALADAASSGRLRADAEAARNICDSSIYESMDLDEIIISCLFHHIESFCPSSESSESFQTFLRQIDWQLPYVVWEWTASPPPPPGLLARGPLARLAVFDPEGFALAEQALDDFFPPLEYVASHSTGSRIRNKYGPKYFVNKYEISMAFMAAENFRDKNSIGARMIQARYTNYGRFSCAAMMDFASERDNAAAGTDGPASARFENPSDYISPYDRNWLVYFATVFTESLMKEVGGRANFLEVNVLEFWQQQCEEPAAYRAPVPTSMWQADPKRLGTVDAFDTSVEVRDFAPLVSFGSLRQLRSADGAAAQQWPEDATTVINSEQNRFVRGGDNTNYGRRAEEEAPDAERNVFDYKDENVSIASMDERPGLGSTRRGRGLLMNFFIGKLIKKALGNPFKANPYDRIQKQYNFEVPNQRRSHFYWDRVGRSTNVARDLQRDVFCNPDYKLTLEQTVGDPPPHAFSDTIVDSSSAERAKDMVVQGTLRGGDVNRNYGSGTGPGGSSPKYKDTSLQQWVYVTSSDDPSVAPGFHRLADLKLFPTLGCDQIKNQPCGSTRISGSGSTSSWQAIRAVQRAQQRLYRSGFTGAYASRRSLSSSVSYAFINTFQYVEPAVNEYKTGTEVLLNARCSSFLASRNVPGATPCVGARTSWYSLMSSGCSRGRLELVDTSIYQPLGDLISRFQSPT